MKVTTAERARLQAASVSPQSRATADVGTPDATRIGTTTEVAPGATWTFSIATPQPYRRAAGHGFVVEIPRLDDRPRVEIHRGRTDENGGAEIDWVSTPGVLWEEAQETLQCRITDPGFLNTITTFRSRVSNSKPRLGTYISPRPGIETCVQLVNSDGDNVSGTFFIETPQGSGSGRRHLLESRKTGFARVSVPVDMEATLRAYAGGVGTAAIRFDELAASHSADSPMPLLVVGPASIAGVLLSSAGEPLSGIPLSLEAVIQEPEAGEPRRIQVDSETGHRARYLSPSYAGPMDTRTRVTPESGTTEEIVVTNERGEFKAGGLITGEFEVLHARHRESIGTITSGEPPHTVRLTWNRVYVREVVVASAPTPRTFEVRIRQDAVRDTDDPINWNVGRFFTVDLGPNQGETQPSKRQLVTPGSDYDVRINRASAIEPVKRDPAQTSTTGYIHRFQVDAIEHETTIRVVLPNGDLPPPAGG